MSSTSLNSTSRLTPIETPDIEISAGSLEKTPSRLSRSLSSLVSNTEQQNKDSKSVLQSRQANSVSKLDSDSDQLKQRRHHNRPDNAKARGIKSKGEEKNDNEGKEEKVKEEAEEDEDEDDDEDTEEEDQEGNDEDQGEDTENDEDKIEDDSESEAEEESEDEDDDENKKKEQPLQDEEKKNKNDSNDDMEGGKSYDRGEGKAENKLLKGEKEHVTLQQESSNYVTSDELIVHQSAMLSGDSCLVVEEKDVHGDTVEKVTDSAEQEINEADIRPTENKSRNESLEGETNNSDHPESDQSDDVSKYANNSVPYADHTSSLLMNGKLAHHAQQDTYINKENITNNVVNTTESLQHLNLEEKGNVEHSFQEVNEQNPKQATESDAQGDEISSEIPPKKLIDGDMKGHTSASELAGEDMPVLPTSISRSYSSKSRQSLTSAKFSRGSAASLALSQETLDDVLTRETIEGVMSLNEQSDTRQKVSESSLHENNKVANARTTSHDEASDVARQSPVQNEDDAISGRNDDKKILTALSRKSSTHSLTDNKLNEYQPSEELNEEDILFKDGMVKEDRNSIDIEFQKSDSIGEDVHNDSGVSTRNERDTFSIKTIQTDSVSPENGFTENSQENRYLKTEINVEPNEISLNNNTTTFDDSVENSYFAQFGTHAHPVLSPDNQTSCGDDKDVTDRPVVQNIVRDFISDSQTDILAKPKTSSTLYVQNEDRGSISHQADIDSRQTDYSPSKNCPERTNDSKEKDHSPANFLSTPQTHSDGSGGDLDNQLVPFRIEKDKGNGGDNYVVKNRGISLETEITNEKPLTILSNNNQTENAGDTPKQTFTEEPQLQEIVRGDNTGFDKKESPQAMEPGIQQNIATQGGIKNASYPSKHANGREGKPGGSSKKSLSSQVRPKHSLGTFIHPQEMRAIDRIRLGPYSHSIRSPTDKLASPRKTHLKTDFNNESKPTTPSSARIHDTTNNRKTIGKVTPRHQKNNTARRGKEDVRLKEEKVRTDGNVAKSNSNNSNNNNNNNSNKTNNNRTGSEDTKEPTGEESGTVNVSENSQEDSQEGIDKKSLEPTIDLVDLKPVQTSGLSVSTAKCTTKSSIPRNENIELRNREKDLLTSKDKISSPRGIIFKTVSGQDKGSKVIESSLQETSLNQGIFSAQSTERIVEKQTDFLVEVKPVIDSKTSTVITTASVDKPVLRATPIDSNNILITTTPVSPSSSKSDGNDIILDKVAVQPTVNLKNAKPKATLNQTKPSPMSSALAPTTVVVEDETTTIDRSTKTKAGQLVLNSIQRKIREKSLSASLNSASSVPLHGTSASPDSSLGNSGSSRTGKLRPAVKTTSMSSLTVPHGLAIGVHPSSPEEDSLSLTSRRDSARPSVDAMSRRSVDYRIRTTATVIQAPGEADKSKSMLTRDESYIKSAIPCLPLGLAVTCLVLNICLPGFGTILSGVSLLCCGQTRQSSKSDQTLNILCANCMVGLAQLFTVTFMLVGWFWAIGWGIHLVSLSGR
ncbi:hypothetical protein EGW08_005684, partial [Elysia chlorotica]